jgi:hypothetical protein
VIGELGRDQRLMEAFERRTADGGRSVRRDLRHRLLDALRLFSVPPRRDDTGARATLFGDLTPWSLRTRCRQTSTHDATPAEAGMPPSSERDVPIQ